MSRPAVAIIGASADPSKYGNISIKSHLSEGWDVYPVNPKETAIDGLKCYRSILDVPVPLTRISIYLPPAVGMKVIEEVAKKGAREVYLNPGSDSDELVEKARSLGLNAVIACSITQSRPPTS